MDLLLFQFSMFASRHQADDSASLVDRVCHLVALFERKTEHGPQHVDYVLVGMIVIVPQNYLILGLSTRASPPLILLGRTGFFGDIYRRHDCGLSAKGLWAQTFQSKLQDGAFRSTRPESQEERWQTGRRTASFPTRIAIIFGLISLTNGAPQGAGALE